MFAHFTCRVLCTNNTVQGAKYGITNEALVGAMCIPVGFGNIGKWRLTYAGRKYQRDSFTVGSAWAGPYSDRLLLRMRSHRGGVWIAEDRLRATHLGGVLAPLSLIVSGFLTQFWEGNGSLIPNLICLVVNGIGVRTTWHLECAVRCR